MPIDWTALADAFRLPLRSQTTPLALAFQRLGVLLGRRLLAAQRAERATRLFPIIGFRGDAIRVYVDRSQHGTLTGPPGDAPSLSGAGRRFVAGLGVIPNAVQEATLIPRLFGLVLNFIRQVEAAVNRSVPPRPEIFDPRGRTGMDIFGAAGLLVWGTATGLGQIQTLTRGLTAMRDAWKSPERLRMQRSIGRVTPSSWQQELSGARSDSSTQGGALQAETGLSLPARLDNYARYIVAGVLVLPLLGVWLELVLRAANIRFRTIIVTSIGQVVSFLFGIRRRIAHAIGVTLPEYARQAFGFALVIARNMIETLGFVVTVATLLGEYLRDSVGLFLKRVSLVVNIVIAILNGIAGLFRGFLNFDLMSIILPVLGLPPGIPGAPSLTLADLAEAGLQGGILLARMQLEGWLTGAELAVQLAPLPGGTKIQLLRKLGLLRQIVRAAVIPMAPLPLPPRPPTLPALPNLYDLAFGGPQTAALFNRLDETREGLAREVPALFESGAVALSDAAALFHRRAVAESQVGSLDQYRALSEQAVAMADTVFGSQRRELAARVEGEAYSPLASAFELWLIHGGFETVGQSIPLFVDHMVRYWRQQTSEEPSMESTTSTPTSPHILERHRRVGTVRMGRLTLRIPAAPLDDDLAQEISTGFRRAVAEAYATASGMLAEGSAG